MKTPQLMPTAHFDAGVLPRRSVPDGEFLSPSDPAIMAVTDFTREHPVTVDAERQIDDALNDMIRVGVRALLVSKDQRIVGLITSYDIQGERPIQFLQSSNYSHHREIRVSHIMTPWHVLTAIPWDAIQAMSVGELLDLVQQSQLTHVLVVESVSDNETCVVRALVSRARLLRRIAGMRRTG